MLWRKCSFYVAEQWTFVEIWQGNELFTAFHIQCCSHIFPKIWMLHANKYHLKEPVKEDAGIRVCGFQGCLGSMLAVEMSFPDPAACPWTSFPLECHISHLMFEIEILLFHFTQLKLLLQFQFWDFWLPSKKRRNQTEKSFLRPFPASSFKCQYFMDSNLFYPLSAKLQFLLLKLSLDSKPCTPDVLIRNLHQYNCRNVFEIQCLSTARAVIGWGFFPISLLKIK